MDRRAFRSARRDHAARDPGRRGNGGAGQARAEPAPAAAVRMKVGTQHGSTDEILKVLAPLGVNNICSSLPSEKLDASWSADGLKRLRERVESFGIQLDMVPLPLSSSVIERAENPNIMLGKSPERDRETKTSAR